MAISEEAVKCDMIRVTYVRQGIRERIVIKAIRIFVLPVEEADNVKLKTKKIFIAKQFTSIK